jgi:hypothetical protein
MTHRTVIGPRSHADRAPTWTAREDGRVLVLGGLLVIVALAVVVPFVTSWFANTTLPPEPHGDAMESLRRRFDRWRRRRL